MYLIKGISIISLKELEIELGYKVIIGDYLSKYGMDMHDISKFRLYNKNK